MKLTDEQKKVIRSLADSGGIICYYKGGFWSFPGQTLNERGALTGWYTTSQTVASMERRGLLERAPDSTNYPDKADLLDRKLTALALTFVGPVVFRRGGGK